MTPPLLAVDRLSPGAVDQALSSYGGFLLDVSEADLPLEQALSAAHSLFALPRAEKVRLSIERSPHFRGWSEMHNERDWREQMHFGRELAAAGDSPPFRRLEGPNLWPREPVWRAAVQDYMHATTALGETILRQVARALGIDAGAFDGVARSGYVVMKMIGYHPQQSDSARPGVAAHVDFSWLTLTCQDSPGLSVRSRAGDWTVIEPRPRTVWVHAGELLQFATRGRYRATPHRVINLSAERTRVSIPLFVNPPLDASVRVSDLPGPIDTDAHGSPDDSEHVHRVLGADASSTSFHFGEAEWRRKGLGGWCAICCR